MIDPRRARRLTRLSEVKRWAAIPTLQDQSVAEHSFNVMCITEWLMQFHVHGDTPQFRYEAMRAAMLHDEGEALSGDIDATYKTVGGVGAAVKKFETENGLGPIPTSAETLVKLADKLEALLFVDTELLMGNHRLQDVRRELLSKIKYSWESEFQHRSLATVGTSIEAEFMCAFDPMTHPSMEGP